MDTIKFNITSDHPLPENLEEISNDVIAITSVAIIARGKMETVEDAEAITNAVYAYTDGKEYDRFLVAQMIYQLVNQLSPTKEPNQDGN